MPTLATSSQLNLNYQVDGSGPVTLLLCNGASLPLTFWGSLADRLATAFRVVRFDQRNAGETKFEGEFTLGDIAADMDNLLTHLDIDQAVVIGHAWGGRVAQVFARDYPHRVAGMVICGTGGQFPAVDMRDTLQAMVAARRDNHRDQWQQHVEAAYCAAGAADRNPERFQQLVDAIWHAPRHKSARWNTLPYPSESYWGKTSVPTLLIYGQEDKNGTPQNAEHLHERLTNSRLMMLQQAGHFVVREQEDAVLEAVTEFVNSLS